MTTARAGSRQRWVMGGVLIALGVVALVESRRLYHLRTQTVAGAVVGDDTLPLIVGIALLAFGVLVALVTPPDPVKVTWPAGRQRVQMLTAAGLLAAYWLMLPYVGYTGSTAVVSIGLYRAMGGYRWSVSVLLGAVTAGLLYLMFRVWLLEPLPTGWLGF